MAELDLDAIEARTAAASDEQWTHMCLGSEGCVVTPKARTLRERARRVAMFGYREWTEDHHNAEFIAHAREDVPALLALVAERTAERDVLADKVAGRDEAIERVRTLHREWKLYEDCVHHHAEDDPGVLHVREVGYVCDEAYLRSVCRECCTDDGEYQSLECTDNHAGHQCWPCPTKVALDGEPESKETGDGA